MAHSSERKQYALDILYSKAEGNTSKCARLTGIDRKTIQKWKEEHKECDNEQESGEIPTTELMKQKIIKRVYQIIDTCTDPKKLMETYELLQKYEKINVNNKESLFDTISRKLSEK